MRPSSPRWPVILTALLAACAPPLAGTKPIAFAVLQDYDKGTPLDSVARDFALIRELGIASWRGSFGWDDCEPAPGRFDFEWLHRFADTAARYGIAHRPYIGYTPTWAANGGSHDGQDWNDPPRSLADGGTFVRRLGAELRSHRNVRSLEIYNEENVRQWWDGSAPEYAALLARAAAAVDSVAPGMPLLMGGLVYPDVAWIDTVCAARGIRRRLGAIAIHAYAETWTPAEVTVERWLGMDYRRRFLPAVRPRCGAAPIWINEAGFATAPGKTERDQAAWWARAIATFLSDSAVEQIGLYQLHDQQPAAAVIGEAENRHLGLLRLDGTRKLAFQTVRLLVDLLGTGRLRVADAEVHAEPEEGRADSLHAHLFERPDRRRVLVTWVERGDARVRLTLARPGRRATSYGLDASGERYAAFDGRVLRDVRLTAREPRIFVVDAGP